MSVFCYQHHIVKYDDDTTGLTLMQHGAYRRLIDSYYRTGGKLPANFKQLFIVVSCQNKAERDAVAYAVGRFFSVGEDGYLRQNGCEKELKRILNISEENRRKANIKHSKNKGIGSAGAEPVQCREPANNQQSTIKEEDAKASLSKPADPRLAEFEEFWGLYPRKVAKPNALKAYLKSRKKGATHAEIIDGLRKYIASVAGKDPAYIAHGASWLNAERWHDVIAAQGSASYGKSTYGDSIANAARAVGDMLRKENDLRS